MADSLLGFAVINKMATPEVQMRAVRRQVVRRIDSLRGVWQQRRNQKVSHFSQKTRPVYDAKLEEKRNGIEFQIVLRNANQNIGSGSTNIKTLTGWLFKYGTRAHQIRAKRGMLVFPWGGPGSYDRKLKVGGQRGSGRIRGASIQRRIVVNHPGFQPSAAMRKVDGPLSKRLVKDATRGYRDGLPFTKAGGGP